LRSSIQDDYLRIDNSIVHQYISEIHLEVYPDLNDRALWTVEDYQNSMRTLREHYNSIGFRNIAQYFKPNLTKADLEYRMILEEYAEYDKLGDHVQWIKEQHKNISQLKSNLKRKNNS